MTDAWAKLCENRPCINCGADDGTIVPAHANQIRLGKGMGLKAEPWTVIPLCSRCHAWLDNSNADRVLLHETYNHCWNRHMIALLQAGLIQVTGHNPREKVPVSIPKIVKRGSARKFSPEAA